MPDPEPDRHKYLLVELKRPGLVVGRKELDRVEDYLNAMKGQRDFSRTATRRNFFLVTTEYNDSVVARINQSGRPAGIAQRGNNYSLWAKTRGQVLRESDTRHQFIQDRLEIDVTDTRIETRVQELQKSVMRS